MRELKGCRYFEVDDMSFRACNQALRFSSEVVLNHWVLFWETFGYSNAKIFVL